MKTSILGISIVTSSLLLLAGCGSSSSSSTYKGVSVDGYLKGATVELDGYKTTTDANGSWSISIPGNIPTNTIVTTTGGTDITTGEKFEGKLSAIVDTNNTPTVATPLTSLVVPLVQKGLTKSEALNKVAKELNVTVSAITSDPIANLSSTNPDVVANAQKVIKQSLIVQKVAEAFAKSVVKDANNTDFNKITNAVFKHIANQLDKNISLDSAVTNTGGIASGVATIVKDDKSIKIKNVSKKLTASASAIKSVADTLIAVSPENITKNSLDKTSKAIEIITATTEKKLTVISEANTTAGIDAGKASADKVADGFLANGVDTIVATVTKDTNASKVVNKIVKNTNNGDSISNMNITNIIDTSKDKTTPTADTNISSNQNLKSLIVGKTYYIALNDVNPPHVETLEFKDDRTMVDTYPKQGKETTDTFQYTIENGKLHITGTGGDGDKIDQDMLKEPMSETSTYIKGANGGLLYKTKQAAEDALN